MIENNLICNDTKNTSSIKHSLVPAPTRIQSLNIEVSGSCNLRCAGCRRTTENIDNDRGKRTMSFYLFKEIINKITFFDSIVFTGEGEPTLNKDLPKMVSYLKKRNKNITLVTNLVSRQISYYENILKLGVNSLAISVDSLQQDMADILRYGTSTKKLKERLSILSSSSRTPLRIFIAVGKANQTDVFETLRELNNLGKFSVMLAEYMDKGRPEWCQSNLEKKQLVINMITRAVEWPNLKISLPAFAFERIGKCTRPFTSPAINVDGYLTPCCSSFNADVYDKNIMNENWQSVWARDGVQKWLHDFNTDQGDAAELCRVCILNPRRFLGLIKPQA